MHTKTLIDLVQSDEVVQLTKLVSDVSRNASHAEHPSLNGLKNDAGKRF